ncbi:protein HBS1 [Condylostylus longicornis]|uniref:protein HBS1 n=1 Tax=Condylostylus longicornis TaxID=2530218 RepID=UPI00244DC5FF|nr:protein HBS1 [Condylostylus longicornis]
MSRHRIVRAMDYSDEYDGYDDVYGHSVDDETGISPTDASQWIYDRARGQQSISEFIKTNRNIKEEDEEDDAERCNTHNEKKRRDSENFQMPVLDDLEKIKLTSCIDEIRNVVGDTFSDKKIVDAVMQHNFDYNTALDSLLNDNSKEKQNQPIIRENLDLSISHVREKQTKLANMAPVTVIVTPQNDKNVKKGFDLSEDKREGSGRNTPEVQILSEEQKSALNKLSREQLQETARKLFEKERTGEKSHLHMVVIGHVDAGKSTLMGHLLYDTGNVSQRVMSKHEHESKKIGKQSFMYAWVLDETGEERSRGITMDVGSSRIETKSKIVTLLDAPGHKDFIPNMISGASQADVALLVVDATRGEFETGFEQGGQTREHALLVRSLGVTHLGVVVNKLDTVDWSQERFNEIVGKLKSFLKQAGFKENDVTFIPCSGLTGENLVNVPTDTRLTNWYNGPTLLDVIDNFKIPEKSIDKPLRMSISDIFKGTGSNFCISGRIESGFICTNDKVLINPVKETAVIKSISIDETSFNAAFAGDQCSVTISGVDVNNIWVGCVICDIQNPIPISTRIQARILIFNIKFPITIGYPVILHHQSLIEPASVNKLISIVHKATGEIIKKKPRVLTKNTCAIIEIETTKPICVEKFSDYKELGRITLRVGGITIAAGTILKYH